jgi:hypothetical protein
MGIFRKRNPVGAAALAGWDDTNHSHDAVTGAPAPEDVAIWPRGIARFADGILEVTTGEGIRVAASDISEIAIAPPVAGRLSLAVSYRAGLDKVGRSYWVERRHDAALRALVAAVRAAA